MPDIFTTILKHLQLNGSALAPLFQAKLAVPIAFLSFFWLWETWQPFFGQTAGRGRHAVRNLTMAVMNSIVVAMVFSTLTTSTAVWAAQHRCGLLHQLGSGPVLRFFGAILLLEGWMYAWHRANHAIPFLWRFHRMHHSDDHMDVTTATRFHLGEQVFANALRWVLIPLLGLEIRNIVVYDLMVIVATQFHHADISLGGLDRWLRWVVVTPDMHKVHHSRRAIETHSNFSVVFSFWDRLAATFCMRRQPHTIEFGLEEYSEPHWQSIAGMLKTPFVDDSLRRRRSGCPPSGQGKS